MSIIEKLQNLMDRNPEFKKDILNMHEAYVVEMRRQLDVPDDWSYTRQRMIKKDWDKLVDILGEQDIRVVSGNSFHFDKDMNVIYEMSYFYSPEARNRAILKQQELGI